MRRCQYTINRRAVHDYAEQLCQRHVPLKDRGPKCKAGILWAVLFWAASRISSLAAACASLRQAPSDSAAHDALLAALPASAELQRRLNRGLTADLPKGLRKHRQPLACDLTLVPYHGEPLHSPDEIYRGPAKSGTTHFHAYATCYVVHKGQRFTVALTGVKRGEPLAAVLQRLLRQAARAGVRPRYLLLDKGFCSVAVIRYLQRARYGWLMPLVTRGRRPDHPDGPSGSQGFRCWKCGGWGRYTMTAADGSTATFAVCVKCRNRRGERGRYGREALVYAWGGMARPSSPEWVRQTYRQRFGIETSYRQMHQARIRTSTRDPLLRLLYVGVALILRNVWAWLHWEVLSQPRRGGRRIDLGRLTFRGLLLWLQHYAEAWLGVNDEVHTQRPIPKGLMPFTAELG